MTLCNDDGPSNGGAEAVRVACRFWPQDVKRAVTGSKTASKDDVIAAIEVRFPDVEWPKQTTLWEHAADSVGVVLACLDSPALQMARRLAG